MFPAPYFEILSLLTEISLCLSPLVIKSVGTTVETTVLIKVMVYVLIAFIISSPKDFKSVTELSFSNLIHYIIMGSLSFITLSLTYFGFKELPLSLSMLINYSFPIVLVLISHFFLGYPQPLYILPFFILAYIVMVYNLKPHVKQVEQFQTMNKEKKYMKYKAIAALILGSTLTSIGFIIKKMGFDSHETGMIRANLGALIISILMFIKSAKAPDLRPDIWLKLLIFNILIGYIISKFRSLAFNSVSEIYYGIFVFLGALVAYKISVYHPKLRPNEPIDFLIEDYKTKQ